MEAYTEIHGNTKAESHHPFLTFPRFHTFYTLVRTLVAGTHVCVLFAHAQLFGQSVVILAF